MGVAVFLMIVCGFCYALFQGNTGSLSRQVMQAGQQALETGLGLAGSFMFFGGVIRILEKAGAQRALTQLLRRPLRWLFGPEASQEAMEAVSVNLAANMLGMGNMATPMGMRAAKLLNTAGQSVPSAALCMLLVINATSVQLMPASVIALRYAAGSASPGAIVLPSLAASSASTVLGILLCKAFEKRGAKA